MIVDTVIQAYTVLKHVHNRQAVFIPVLQAASLAHLTCMGCTG